MFDCKRCMLFVNTIQSFPKFDFLQACHKNIIHVSLRKSDSNLSEFIHVFSLEFWHENICLKRSLNPSLLHQSGQTSLRWTEMRFLSRYFKYFFEFNSIQHSIKFDSIKDSSLLNARPNIIFNRIYHWNIGK